MPRALSLRLSVLDQSPIPEGSSGAEALQNSLDLARHAEALGYHRYWVAEHHGAVMLACTSPEVLIPVIASVTSSIRVGSGGVMLPHYSPLKVAESFSMPSGLSPGRIALALGRAAGTDPFTSHALQRDRRQAPPDDFPQQLAELLAYLDDAIPAGHQFQRLAVLPGRPERPEPWLLGSSAQSGVWAAQAALPYAFADFINPAGAPVATRYRQDFAATTTRREPYVIVAVAVICAESDADAQRVASSARMAFIRLHQGELIAIPPPETAIPYLAGHASVVAALSARRRFIVGAPGTVRLAIDALAQEYRADEVMIVTITHHHTDRLRSYELLAEACSST